MNSIQLAWLIRRHGIEMTHLSGGSHIGAIMSVADIIAVLYADIMRYDPEDPKWSERDRFILSKGHAGAAIYAALAESGFFDPAELKTPPLGSCFALCARRGFLHRLARSRSLRRRGHGADRKAGRQGQPCVCGSR